MTTTATPLSDLDELLFRQVHPSFVRDGRPSSQAFRPTLKDVAKLSVARASMTTARDSYDLDVSTRGHASAGVWAV